MSYNEKLEQVLYDANEYKKLVGFIDRNTMDLPNWIGKPKHGVILESIEIWEERIKEIKKTFIPAMKDLIEELNY